jgi:hypothetical protein
MGCIIYDLEASWFSQSIKNILNERLCTIDIVQSEVSVVGLLAMNSLAAILKIADAELRGQLGLRSIDSGTIAVSVLKLGTGRRHSLVGGGLPESWIMLVRASTVALSLAAAIDEVLADFGRGGSRHGCDCTTAT